MAKPDSWMPMVTQNLIAEGWRTPNTYAGHFDEIPSAPGVYLFLVHRDDWDAPGIGYVGKSTCLHRRIERHKVLRAISGDNPDALIQRWFLARPAEEITGLEAETIRKFNPAYNIQLRPRGFCGQA